MRKVKERAGRRSGTRISSKHQVTLPVHALEAGGLRVGERLLVRVAGPGRLVLEREEDILARYAGRLTGIYEQSELDRLRDEWR